MTGFKRVLLAVAGAGLVSATGIALAQETPAAAPAGVKLVEAAAVQALQAKGAVLIDTRKASEFSEATIKGAIAVPYDPEKSAKGAVVMAKAGYKNVHWYRNGVPDWKARKLPME